MIDLSIPPNAMDKTKNEGHCLVTYADHIYANKVLDVSILLMEEHCMCSYMITPDPCL